MTQSGTRAGVFDAVSNVNGEIAETLVGFDATDQQAVDAAMINRMEQNKSRLGANVILVSLPPPKLPDYSEFPLSPCGRNTGTHTSQPMMNIINGGEHADNPIDIQEFMILPVSAPTMRDAVRVGSEVFHTLKKELSDAGFSTSIGDEGGFAPNLSSTRVALDFILKSIEKVGYKPGEDIYLALDCASTEYFKNGKYEMIGENASLSSAENVAYLAALVNDYPIISIEDAWPKTIGTAGQC